jgi:hypothetical protein
MGGGRRFEYPKWVWSPAGGWWANPTHWKRNTMIYGVVSLAIVAVTYNYSEKNTVSIEGLCFASLIE